ncbi:MAG: hypothetical protein ABWY12_07310 [Burkholderiales bacterium]
MTITASLALLPDSPDSRALVELSSHLNDLSDAEHALSAALEVADDDPLWPVLTGYATTAYMRAFLPSQVRRRLLELVQIPPEHLSLHETIHKFRNTTIAHSQSELVMILPLAVLNESGTIRAVTDMVVSQHLPRRTAEAFALLIADVLDLVEHAAQSLRERLRTRYADVDAATIASWPDPEIRHDLDDAFTAATKRRHAPAFTMYWRQETPPIVDPPAPPSRSDGSAPAL